MRDNDDHTRRHPVTCLGKRRMPNTNHCFPKPWSKATWDLHPPGMLAGVDNTQACITHETRWPLWVRGIDIWPRAAIESLHDPRDAFTPAECAAVGPARHVSTVVTSSSPTWRNNARMKAVIAACIIIVTAACTNLRNAGMSPRCDFVLGPDSRSVPRAISLR